ncbi:MAG: hypothetical protein WDM81_14160 [Rhizomicrobium sp.]
MLAGFGNAAAQSFASLGYYLGTAGALQSGYTDLANIAPPFQVQPFTATDPFAAQEGADIFAGVSAVVGGRSFGSSLAGPPSDLVPVGRWMGNTEYQAMFRTGKVQESTLSGVDGYLVSSQSNRMAGGIKR